MKIELIAFLSSSLSIWARTFSKGHTERVVSRLSCKLFLKNLIDEIIFEKDFEYYLLPIDLKRYNGSRGCPLLARYCSLLLFQFALSLRRGHSPLPWSIAAREFQRLWAVFDMHFIAKFSFTVSERHEWMLLSIHNIRNLQINDMRYMPPLRREWIPPYYHNSYRTKPNNVPLKNCLKLVTTVGGTPGG